MGCGSSVGQRYSPLADAGASGPDAAKQLATNETLTSEFRTGPAPAKRTAAADGYGGFAGRPRENPAPLLDTGASAAAVAAVAGGQPPGAVVTTPDAAAAAAAAAGGPLAARASPAAAFGVEGEPRIAASGRATAVAPRAAAAPPPPRRAPPGLAATTPLCGAEAGLAAHRGAEREREEMPADVSRLELRSFEQLEVVDETPMSTVVRLRHHKSGQILAGKRIKRGCRVHASGDFLNEVRMLRKLAKVPSVVALHGICDGTSDFWTVMELCAGGRLEPWLGRSPETARGVAQELVEAVKILHSMLICHLDLKPDNVLLTEAGQVRLIDFVTACQLSAAGQQLAGNCGTEGFRAPEVGSGRTYSGLMADVFSLGQTLRIISDVEPGWRELTRICRKMAEVSPGLRPEVASVHTSLFGAIGDDVGLMLDFASLETVSSMEASRSTKAAMVRAPSDRNAPACQWSAPRSLAQPPEIRSLWSGGGAGPLACMLDSPQEGIVTRSKKPTGGRTGSLGPLPPLAEKGRTSSQRVLVDGQTSQVAMAALPTKTKVAARPPPSCGSSTCTHLGICLCNDRAPGAAPTGRAKGMRRCNTPP